MDHYILTGPNGSHVDLGSWLMADPGPDFGAKDLIRAEYAESPLSEGGLLAAEHVGVRRFSFPLRPRSCAGIAGGLPGVEAFIASLAQPGAYVDLMPEGTATADAVRFDVLGGRYEESYSVALQRIGRREGELKLEVEPYGYWPSTLTLASVASIGLPGRLAINAASILGDALALARLAVQPTAPTSYPLGTWAPDMIAWSLGARPSALPFWPAASLGSAIAGALVGDAFAPGSQAVALYPVPSYAQWQPILVATIASALEPAYRGRFHGFAWAQFSPSQTVPFQLSLDAVPAGNPGAALASAQPVATLAPIVRGVSVAAASPAYHLLDLGEIVLPPVASGLQQTQLLRLWGGMASPIGVATPLVKIGGLYLQPVDGDSGILSQGLGVPTFVAPSPGRFVSDAQTGRSFVGAAPTNLALDVPLTPAPYYRGARPRLTPTVNALDLLAGSRRTDLGMLYRDEVLADSPAAYYSFDDAVPTYMNPIIGPTGVYRVAPTQAPAAILGLGRAKYFGGTPSTSGVASGVLTSAAAWSYDLWMKIVASAAFQNVLGLRSLSPTSWSDLRMNGADLAIYIGNASLAGWAFSTTAPFGALPMASYAHVAVAFSPTYVNIFINGSLIGSWAQTIFVRSATSSLAFGLGFVPSGEGWPANVMIDEFAYYKKCLSPSRVAAHYQAGISPSAGATAPLIRGAKDFAAVSLTYRPRFRFLKSF